MYKELIISIVIIFTIVSLEYVTKEFTSNKINEMNTKLQNLKSEMSNEDVDYKKLTTKAEEVKQIWEDSQNIMAFYIEHNELEKVETEFTASLSLIYTKQYDFAISGIDRTEYILKHIEDKYKFKLENIF